MAVDSTLQCFLACEEMELLGDFVPSAMSRRDVKSHLDSFNNFLAFDWKISHKISLGIYTFIFNDVRWLNKGKLEDLHKDG